MKNRLVKFSILSRFMIVILIGQIGFTPAVSFAEGETTAPPKGMIDTQVDVDGKNGDCNAICDPYFKTKVDEQEKGACGAIKGDGSVKTVNYKNPDKSEEFTDQASCKARLQEDWQILGQHCTAYKIGNNAKDAELAGAIMWTAAFALCTSAAALCTGDNPFTKPACKGTAITCAVLSFGSIGADIAAAVKAAETKSQFEEVYLNPTKNASNSQRANEDYNDKSNGVNDDEFHGVRKQDDVNGQIASSTISMASGVTSGVLAAVGAAKEQKKDLIAAACISGIQMVVHWAMYGHHQKMNDDACHNIKELPGFNFFQKLGSDDIRGPTEGNLGAGGLGGLDAKTAGGGRNKSSQASIDRAVESAQAAFSGGGSSFAATGDPLGKYFPNKKMMPDALKEHLGLSLKDIGKAIASGQSPAQFFASSSLPQDMKEAIADMDKMAKNGQFSIPGGGGDPSLLLASYNKGGGGGGSKPGAKSADTNPFGMFGKKLDGAADRKPTGLSFVQLDENDIWHAAYKGSIFQIVTNRIDKSKTKVEPREWQSPINRGLQGLPQLPKGK